MAAFIYTTKAGKKLRAMTLQDVLAKAGITYGPDVTPRAFIGGTGTAQAGKIVVTYGEVPQTKAQAQDAAVSSGAAGDAVSLRALQEQVAALMAALGGQAPAAQAPAKRGRKAA